VTTPRIEVTIDEVVLRGIPPERAREVVAGLEASLARQARQALEDGRVPGRDRRESSRRLGGTVTGRADDGRGLGAALAGAVWREVAGATGAAGPPGPRAPGGDASRGGRAPGGPR
jgi:hypothetical protein